MDSPVTMIARPHRETAYPIDGGPADPSGLMAAFSRHLAVARDLDSAVSTLLGGVMTALEAMGAGLFVTTTDDESLTCRAALGDIGSAGVEASADTDLIQRSLSRGTATCASPSFNPTRLRIC